MHTGFSGSPVRRLRIRIYSEVGKVDLYLGSNRPAPFDELQLLSFCKKVWGQQVKVCPHIDAQCLSMCPAFLYSDWYQAEETSLTHDIAHCQTKSDQVKGQSRVQSLNHYHLALCGNLYKFPSLIFSLELVLLHPQPVSPSYSYCVIRHFCLPKAQVGFSYFS